MHREVFRGFVVMSQDTFRAKPGSVLSILGSDEPQWNSSRLIVRDGQPQVGHYTSLEFRTFSNNFPVHRADLRWFCLLLIFYGRYSMTLCLLWNMKTMASTSICGYAIHVRTCKKSFTKHAFHSFLCHSIHLCCYNRQDRVGHVNWTISPAIQETLLIYNNVREQ